MGSKGGRPGTSSPHAGTSSVRTVADGYFPVLLPSFHHNSLFIMGKIIVIDDDAVCRRLLTEQCTRLGHATEAVGSIEAGTALLAHWPADLVFLDVSLPDGNGLEALPVLQGLPSMPEVIIITGTGDANGAELAIKNGAWDYLQKPLSNQEIHLHVRRALEYHDKKMLHSDQISLKRDGIVGGSKAISFCLDQVARCAATDSGVLITGATGTGKEVFARTIHANSRRAQGPFVVVDCASLPEQLVESILFGHVKGAFTGAHADRIGLVELANNGTLFLDEAGELPLDMQKTFLRVLQERVFRPVGKDREHTSDFRLIAATNRDLTDMVAKGLFRSDLYYRINTFNIHLPSLREREQDIEKLVMSFVFSICRRNRLPIKGVVPETLETLAAYHWPGNVRELENVIEKALIAAAPEPVLYPIHLPPEIRLSRIRTKVSEKRGQAPTAADPDAPFAPERLTTPATRLPFKEYRRLLTNDIERHYLRQLLHETEGDIAKACAASGLSRSRLYDLLKVHSLTGSADPSPA